MRADDVSGIRRVGFVVNVQKGRSAELTASLTAILRKRGIEFFCEAENAEFLGMPGADADSFQSADLCVVLGGDGTMLRASRILGNSEVPLLGIHLGSLGFLMENMADEAKAALDSALTGDIEVTPRLRLRVRVFSGFEDERVSPEPRYDVLALNEATVSRGLLSRIIELKTCIDGFPVTCYRADGVIISSPTGSTGYSLSAGGPILAPSLDAIAVTPICPHTLAQRPLVIPGGSHIELTLLPGSSEVILSIDGQQSCPLEAFDRIRIEAAATRTLIVRNRNVDFFSILRSRLGWGGGRR